MANEEHLQILKQGVNIWNLWRKERPNLQPDLSRADLSSTKLFGADLHRVDLSWADLSQSDLHGADLSEADLNRAVLRWADLSGASLYKADLHEAHLREADLSGANLSGANLIGADLVETFLGDADFSHLEMGVSTLVGVDLSLVKGLETVRHVFPSHVGIDTIYHSHGKIPEIFLRGTGVPAVFIANMVSMVAAMSPIEFYSCFISYSTKDQQFVDQLHADLLARKVRCWFAPHDLRPGQKLHEQIDAAINAHEKLLLVLSPQSINSEWVKTEIAQARKREIREGRRVLFPIRMGITFTELQEWKCFDADTGKDSAREIREYHIPDFSNWKDHNVYQQSLRKLLEGLEGEKER